MLNPIILIPARLGATRLPNKPLADIQGEPMIVHVWRRGIAAEIGPVVVACCGPEIEEVVTQVGGKAVQTDPNLPRGTDRIHAALKKIEAENPGQTYDVVINLQGDLPTISATLLHQVLAPLSNPDVDISTLGVVIADKAELTNPNVVKIAMTAPQATADGHKIGRALYFSRSLIPSGGPVHYHHIGVYAYRRKALEAYVKLPVSSLEAAEQLEQLRALEAGMRMDVAIVTEIPPSVDTQEDLDAVRKLV
ncbi:MAG: 3-deoxy-manno-octulosonate cytidylyltransferase [Alphaproteobacteria bacterium]|nr:3-deoxy-manno-octulosonate cytidylyltransferase [Alphaproteobacteria bacterium]